MSRCLPRATEVQQLRGVRGCTIAPWGWPAGRTRSRAHGLRAARSACPCRARASTSPKHLLWGMGADTVLAEPVLSQPELICAKLRPHDLRCDPSSVSCSTSTCVLQCRLRPDHGSLQPPDKQSHRHACARGQVLDQRPEIPVSWSKDWLPKAAKIGHELPMWGHVLLEKGPGNMYASGRTLELRHRQEDQKETEVTCVSASWADKTPSSSPELSALPILLAASTNSSMSIMSSRHLKDRMPRVWVDPPPFQP